MAEHTPGPWRTDAEVGHEAVLGQKGFKVADCAIFGRNAPSQDTLRANARLISSAPDLLAATEKGLLWVQWVAANHPDPGFSEPAARAAAEFEAAIAKARGS